MNAVEFCAIAQGRGINAFAATCQSALETGWWTSRLWLEAYNGAGLKAPWGWKGETLTVPSEECIGGRYKLKFSAFRRYLSPAAFLDDYAAKIKADYPESWESADNWPGYFAGLFRGRWGSWATDPVYFDKLVGMAVRLGPELLGDGWKGRMRLAVNLALQRGSLERWQEEAIDKCVS